jgi:hypothetical protein
MGQVNSTAVQPHHFLPITNDSAAEMNSDDAVYTVDDPPASLQGPKHQQILYTNDENASWQEEDMERDFLLPFLRVTQLCIQFPGVLALVLVGGKVHTQTSLAR